MRRHVERYSDKVVTFSEAQRRLAVTDGLFNALVNSWLLGRITTGNKLFIEGIESYERYGTQWMTEDRPELASRTMDAEFLQNIPLPPDVSYRYPSVLQKVFAAHDGIHDELLAVIEASTGWLMVGALLPTSQHVLLASTNKYGNG